MTETGSSPIACNPLPPRQRKAGSVGVPVGLDVAIMDEGGALLPGGKTGQIVVRGASVMSGYDGDPTANQAAFAGDWFKTGDYGFFDDDGYLFLVGRKQEIINRGGEKFAPREVDEVLLEHPAVAEAVTFAVPHPTLGEDVASAVVLRPHVAATPNRHSPVRHRARRRLQDPAPSAHRRGAPKRPNRQSATCRLGGEVGTREPGSSRRKPSSRRGRTSRRCWPNSGPRSSKSNGSVSMITSSRWAVTCSLATHVLARIYDITASRGRGLPYFRDADGCGDGSPSRDVDPGRPGSADVPLAIVRAPRRHGVRATIAQERLWKLQNALPGIAVFQYPLRAPTDVPCRRSCPGAEHQRNRASARNSAHDLCRGRKPIRAGHCVAVECPSDIRRSAEIAEIPERNRDTQTGSATSCCIPSISLTDRSFRARLLRLAEQEHLLLMTMHQIVIDGWSLGVFVERTCRSLRGVHSRHGLAPGAAFNSVPRLCALAAELAVTSGHGCAACLLARAAAHPLPVMKLAAARTRRTIDNIRTARREAILPADLAEAARRFSHGEGGTLFMALVAAFKALLHRYLGQEDLRVATNVANRNRPGTEGLIGRLTNTVILRTDLRGDPSARELLRRVRATTLAAFVHQDFPFGELAEALASEGSAEPAALAQAMITLQSANLRPRASAAHGLAFEEANPNMLMPLVTITSYDIILMLREGTHGLIGTCVYKPALFGARTIDRLLRDFQEVLEQMVTQPDRPISAIRVSRQKVKGR